MGLKLTAIFVLLLRCAFAQQVTVKHLYVETFKTKDGAADLRADVISQLRKLKTIEVVSERGAADAVLSGSGEIWIKGYRSLNPKSGRSPANGTPIYTGYLSVELKGSDGETIWSYLETPGPGSENISKALSSRVVKRLAEAMAQHN